MNKVRTVTWNLPYELWEEMKKTRADLKSVSGLKFVSEEDLGLTLLQMGLEIARRQVDSDRVVAIPEGPWSRTPSLEEPYLRS